MFRGSCNRFLEIFTRQKNRFKKSERAERFSDVSSSLGSDSDFSPQNSDSEDEGMTYEEPDLPAQPPPPPQSRHHNMPPPPPQDFQQETYDDLEDIQPEPTEELGETYDECDLKPVPQQQQQQATYEEEQLYEEEPPSDDFPPPIEENEDGDLYEFMPENESGPPAVPTPPSVSHSRPHIPLPPQPGSVPNLPARPSPSRPPDRDPSPDSVPDLPPGRPVPQGTAKLSSAKKISGDGPQMLGISMEAIGFKRANLKKVVSDESKEPEPAPVEPAVHSDEANSVKARINMFKQAEKGPKPLLPVKPTVSAAAVHSRNLGPPPIPPSRVLGPPPPPPSYAVYKKPAEVKSPPPTVKTPPQPPAVKTPTQPPPFKHSAPAPSFDECDDIYDEGFSYVPDPLSREEWYHGEIERADSNSRLQSVGQDGTFLVRKSKQGGDTQPYTLAVLYQGHVYNLKMRMRNDGQVALGEEKSDELAFSGVSALIHHHKSHDVILVNVKEKKQHKTLLKKHPINMNAN